MNPTLKQAHLQTAQCHHADQSLQKSLLCPPKKKNKKISPASQKLNLPSRKPTDENKLTKKLKPFTDIELTRPKKEPLLTTLYKSNSGKSGKFACFAFNKLWWWRTGNRLEIRYCSYT